MTNNVAQIIEELQETLANHAEEVCKTRCKFYAKEVHGDEPEDEFYDRHCKECPLWKMF